MQGTTETKVISTCVRIKGGDLGGRLGKFNNVMSDEVFKEQRRESWP